MLLFTAMAAASDVYDFSGTWQMVLDTATHAAVPVLGRTSIYTHQTMVATVTRAGTDGFVVSHDVCTLVAETRPALATTHFPDAFVNAIPGKSYPLELSDEGGRLRARMNLQPLAVGYDPDKTTALPQSLDSPSIVDWDNDGKAAATIEIHLPVLGTVEVYQVQVATAILDGWVRSNDEISGGAAVVGLQQRTLGASNRLFVQNPTLSADPSASSFRMTRAPEGTRCPSG
ncbi:MAG: hypothetical protein FJ090_15675 [Deltaproteobacteria bacterium]|nr:hypothetical protein [Deltaproteobacteria bacterium]